MKCLLAGLATALRRGVCSHRKGERISKRSINQATFVIERRWRGRRSDHRAFFLVQARWGRQLPQRTSSSAVPAPAMSTSHADMGKSSTMPKSAMRHADAVVESTVRTHKMMVVPTAVMPAATVEADVTDAEAIVTVHSVVDRTVVISGRVAA